jgi:hypothetical protein
MTMGLAPCWAAERLFALRVVLQLEIDVGAADSAFQARRR